MSAPQSRFVLIVDPVLGCNLKCPSCPVANRPYSRPVKSVLTVERLAQILDKLIREVDGMKINTWLYNWTEPFLHPHLDELVRLVKNKTGYVGLSSNLNIRKTDVLERTLLAQPSGIKISVSGFTQEIYGRSHVGGDIDLVKANMRRISDFMRANGLTETKIWVGYHVYNDNGGVEYLRMRDFCEELGFAMDPYLAFLSPLEWSVEIAEGRADVAEKLADVVTRLPLGPTDVMQMMKARLPYDRACSWQKDMIALDADGNVDLCCRTFEQHLDANFLETSLEEIKDKQNRHFFCNRCRAVRGHQFDRFTTPPVIKSYQDDVLCKALGIEDASDCPVDKSAAG
ncbi:MAG: radical SAM/SPASM domain-containing protein [Proteobacteria bacterium]|nr:radical SAM protein [Alphaproteobacteria bacterium]NCC02973.1 radical SAM/SPASM domain-containing protein [Pseudomonadota bacterium]